MKVKLNNCNNIDSGSIDIIQGRLNIKYAINGTGKSTIAKALLYAIIDGGSDLKQLKPFKYLLSQETEHQPKIEGIDGINNIAIFDEAYIDQYIYQPDELLKNSFDIFVKTPDYEKHMEEIEQLVATIKNMFRNNPELDELLKDMYVFIDGFGKAKSGYSATGFLGKGLGKGNKIANIPLGLEEYTDYLQHTDNVKWLKWQLGGKDYLDISDKCPYCISDIHEKKEAILRVSDEYDSKSIEQLNKTLETFHSLSLYLSEDTNKKIEEISKNISGISSEQKSYLIEIKEQIIVLRNKLEQIKYIGFSSLKDVDKVVEELEKYKINLDYLGHINSEFTNDKIGIINQSLDEIVQKAGKLQGEINQQKITIQKTIQQYHDEINDFLKYAGYKYSVSIDEDGQGSYKMKLKHNDCDSNVEKVKSCLSFGERNAFALVLFMYGALKNNPDLIILDDPISSFDGNKKFAILNMLFMGETSLKNKTVIMFTHEFNSVIDAIYNMPYNFNPTPKAAFLENSNGELIEKSIIKKDIKPFNTIAKKNIGNLTENLNKLVYLRRLFEIEDRKGNAWQLISNLFKSRNIPLFRSSENEEERKMTEEEILLGTKEIQEFINGFDYLTECQKIQNAEQMLKIYQTSSNNYEKLQIYRIINNENSSNSVIKKFVNEAFHIENDYLFQLNPCEYEVVPNYVIDECDKDIFQKQKN